MTDESDSPSQVPPAGGARPEGQPSNGTGDSGGSAGPCDALRNRRRRYILYRLKTATTPMAVADIADDIVRWETDASPPEVQDMRKRVYVSLYHRDLPKLDAADLLSFDEERNLVDIRETGEDLPRSAVRPSADNHPQESD